MRRALWRVERNLAGAGQKPKLCWRKHSAMRAGARRLNRLWINPHKQARSHSPIEHRIT
jgi:hypothetical protein